jgi:hypothetical protein
MTRTNGLSPKLYLPFLSLLAAVLTHWIATGEFDRVEVAGLVATALQGVIAFLASPGDVQYVAPDEDGNPVVPA